MSVHEKPVGYGRTATAEIRVGVCDLCERTEAPVLSLDTSGGEYGDIDLCGMCIRRAFDTFVAENQ